MRKKKTNIARGPRLLQRLYYISKNIFTVYYKGYKAKRIVYVTRSFQIKQSYSFAVGENTFDHFQYFHHRKINNKLTVCITVQQLKGKSKQCQK